MNRISALIALVVLICPPARADQPETGAAEQQVLEMIVPAGPESGGPGVDDYRRCNRDCKEIWDGDMKEERLQCVKGCSSIRSQLISLPVEEGPTD